jgi:hypothetical protein
VPGTAAGELRAAITPADGARRVSVDSRIVATFSEPVDPASVDSSSFTVEEQASGSPVAGSFDFSSACDVVTFAPADLLKNDTRYRIRLASAIRTPGGKTFAGPQETHFTTSPPYRNGALVAVLLRARGLQLSFPLPIKDAATFIAYFSETPVEVRNRSMSSVLPIGIPNINSLQLDTLQYQEVDFSAATPGPVIPVTPLDAGPSIRVTRLANGQTFSLKSHNALPFGLDKYLPAGTYIPDMSSFSGILRHFPAAADFGFSEIYDFHVPGGVDLAPFSRYLHTPQDFTLLEPDITGGAWIDSQKDLKLRWTGGKGPISVTTSAGFEVALVVLFSTLQDASGNDLRQKNLLGLLVDDNEFTVPARDLRKLIFPNVGFGQSVSTLVLASRVKLFPFKHPELDTAIALAIIVELGNVVLY